MRTHQRIVLARASSALELRQAIAKLDTEVPLRTEGRQSEHVERYAIVHLLLSIPASRFRFPISVDHGDRPDFVVEESGRRVAIEHVEAIPENEAKKAALREQSEMESMHFLSHATPGERKKSTKRLLKEIEADEPGDGWVGDSPEREWANAMVYFAVEKAASVTNEGYDRGDETRLLIYDNWPLPHVNPQKAAECFMSNARLPEAFAIFSHIYVMDGSGVWEFTVGRWEHHALQRPGECV